jgi:glycerol-3-phosphate dehydrogenase
VSTTVYDVAVVGAGVVGSAVASALVRLGLSVVLVEAGADVGAGTSKANTAIWHTGFDAKPGTLEAGMVARGHVLLQEGSQRWGWPLRRVGALLVAWDDAQLSRLDAITAQARANGYTAITALTTAQVYAAEPHLGAGVRGALLVPDEGLLDPWAVTLALATDAVVNGATLRRSSPVVAVTGDGDRRTRHHVLSTPGGELRAAWLVNTAGLQSDTVDRLLGHDGFTVTPRRGQLIVFDKLAARLVTRVLLPVPTEHSKGVLVSPTVYGNVLLGPTAEDLPDRTDTATTAEGLRGLLARGRDLLPALVEEEVTATYAGLRAATEHADYCYEVFPADRYVRVGGIRSTGISSALALAERVADDLGSCGLVTAPLVEPVVVRVPDLAELRGPGSRPRPYLDADLIRSDPEYGRIVCHCERVTAGELRDALASPLPPVDLDGLRRRTRALMGRCQGFACGATLTALLEDAP